MSSIMNIPINTRSMNGIITISDGVATMENGDLSNINNMDANTSTIGTLNTNIFNATTNQVDISPIQVQFLGAPNDQNLFFVPKSSGDPFTPLAQTDDAYIGSDSNFIISKKDVYNAIRFTDSNLNLYGDQTIYMEVGANQIANFNPTSVEYYKQVNCNTSVIDDAPLQVRNTSYPSQTMYFMPKASASQTWNPYCDIDMAFIGANVDFTIGKQWQYTAIKIMDTSMNIFADGEAKFIIGTIESITLNPNQIILQEDVECRKQFVNTYTSTTEYENILYGDLWTKKGLSCKNGLYIQNDIVPGSTTYASINSTGNAILPTLLSQATAKDKFTYVTDNTVNTGYIKLCPTANSAFKNPLVSNNDSLILSNGPAGSGLVIARETTNATGLRMDASTLKLGASGSIQFWISGAPSASYSSFDSTGRLILSDGMTVGTTVIDTAGTMTTTTQATSDNSTKVATTAYVKNQNYVSSTVSNTFTANQIFRTGTLNAQPFQVSSTGLATNNPYVFITPVCTATAYNPIVQTNDSLICLSDTSSSPTTSLCFAVHSGAYSGIRIGPQNSQMYSKSVLNQYIWDKGSSPAFQLNATSNISYSLFDCQVGLKVSNAPITLPDTSVSTTSKHDGFQITPTITTPTGNTAQAIASIIFDNGANNSYGTYFFEYHLTINTTSALEVKCALNTTSASLTGNYRDSVYTPAVSFDSNLNNSAMIRIYTTQTWYLNFQVPTGSYTYSAGLFRVTRIA